MVLLETLGLWPSLIVREGTARGYVGLASFVFDKSDSCSP